MSVDPRSSTMQRFFAAFLGMAVAIFTFALAAGPLGASLAAASIALAAGGLVAALAARGRIARLERSAVSRGLAILSVVATLAALVQIGRLAVFMVDSSKVSSSFQPRSDWEVRHSCLSAYYVAAKAVHSASNIYGDSLYTAPDDDPTKIRKALLLGPFKIDVYEYPPTFLLLPSALLWLTPEFLAMRASWFGLNGLLILAAFVTIARAMGPTWGTRALLLSPLVWAATPTLSTLQKGNVQLLVVAASMAGMLLLERRRWAVGGALLAFAVVSKLYPGLLVVYLVARGQWRAVAWTAGFAMLFLATSLALYGTTPFAAFLDHLPGLMSGEAFPAFRNPMAMAHNFSIPGLVFKLKLFGLTGLGFPAARLVGWAYTLVALAVVWLVARRRVVDAEKPLVWLAILIVATLRSPFLPQAYAVFPPLWILTLLAATQTPAPRTLALTLLPWVAFAFSWPMDWPMDPRLLALLEATPQILTVALAAAVLAPRLRVEAPAPGVAELAPA